MALGPPGTCGSHEYSPYLVPQSGLLEPLEQPLHDGDGAVQEGAVRQQEVLCEGGVNLKTGIQNKLKRFVRFYDLNHSYRGSVLHQPRHESLRGATDDHVAALLMLVHGVMLQGRRRLLVVLREDRVLIHVDFI